MKRNIIQIASGLLAAILLTGLAAGVAGAQPPDRGPLTALAWSPAGDHLALGAGRGVWIVEADGLAPIGYLAISPRETGGISAITWSPDGARLAGARFDGVARVWDVATGAPLARLRGHIGAINGLAWSPDGAIIASAGDDLMVRAWDAASGAPLETLRKHTARALCVGFNGDGSRLVSGGADSLTLVWNTATWVSPATPQGHAGAVAAIAFAPDGMRFVTGDTLGGIRLWRAAGGETLATLRDGADPVIALGWRAAGEGDQVLAFSWDGAIRVWDGVSRGQSAPTAVSRGAEPLPVRARAAAFSPDGALLAILAGDGQSALVVETATGAIRGVIRPGAGV